MCCIVGRDPYFSTELDSPSPTGYQNGITQLYLAARSISCSLFMVSPGTDIVYMTRTTAADPQTD